MNSRIVFNWSEAQAFPVWCLLKGSKKEVQVLRFWWSHGLQKWRSSEVWTSLYSDVIKTRFRRVYRRLVLRGDDWTYFPRRLSVTPWNRFPEKSLFSFPFLVLWARMLYKSRHKSEIRRCGLILVYLIFWITTDNQMAEWYRTDFSALVSSAFDSTSCERVNQTTIPAQIGNPWHVCWI